MVVDIIIIVRAAVEEVGGDIIPIDVTITAADDTLDVIIGMIIMMEDIMVVAGEDITGVDVMAVADDVSLCCTLKIILCLYFSIKKYCSHLVFPSHNVYPLNKQSHAIKIYIK